MLLKSYRLIHSCVNKEKFKAKEDYINALVFAIEKEAMGHNSRNFALSVYDEANFTNPAMLFSFAASYGDGDWNKQIAEKFAKEGFGDLSPSTLELNFSKSSVKPGGDSFMRDEHRLEIQVRVKRDHAPAETYSQFVTKVLDDLQKTIFRTVEQLGYVPGSFEITVIKE